MSRSSKDILDFIIANSPHKIYREDTIDFIKANWDKFDKENQSDVTALMGESIGGAAFVWLTRTESERMGRPRAFFILEDKEDPDKHVYYMMHEFGHLECHNKDCICCEDDFAENRRVSEYHADKYAVRRLMEEELWGALSVAIDIIVGHLSAPDTNPYGWAARKLVKTKLWEQARELDAQHFVELREPEAKDAK